MDKFRQRDIETLLGLLNPESKEDEARLVKALEELFGVSADGRVERERYRSVATVVKEQFGDEGYRRYASAYTTMRNADFYERRRAKVRLLNTMKERQSWKHPLAGMLGGPGQAEGGPVQAVVVSKEAEDDIRAKLEKAVIDATTEVKLAPVLKVLVSPEGDFFRLEYAGEVGPEGYARYGALPMWAVETHTIEHAVELALRGLAMAATTKERQGQHLLSGFAESWEGSRAGLDVQT